MVEAVLDCDSHLVGKGLQSFLRRPVFEAERSQPSQHQLHRVESGCLVAGHLAAGAPQLARQVVLPVRPQPAAKSCRRDERPLRLRVEAGRDRFPRLGRLEDGWDTC